MKKAFYIVILFSFYKTMTAQIAEHTKTVIILENTLHPQKPKKKATLTDTFLIIKADQKNQFNLANYDLKKYNIDIIAIPDTSVKPEISDFIKSYQFIMLKGATYYTESDIVKIFFLDSTCYTWGFLYNFNDKGSYMNYYYIFDKNNRLIQFEADCYAQKDYIKYKYSDSGNLVQIDDDDRHITIEYENKSVKRIYYQKWNDKKKQYFPLSYLEVYYN